MRLLYTVSSMQVPYKHSVYCRAHAPKTGEQKWNFSVSLHDVSFYPGNDPCDKNDTEGINNFFHYPLNQQKDKIASHLSP